MRTIIPFLMIFIVLCTCNKSPVINYWDDVEGASDYCENGFQYFYGPIEGTSFSIIYRSDSSFNRQIFQLLKDFEVSLSTYDENSIISRLNKNDSTVIPDAYFKYVFERSAEVSKASNGAFDITVAPLVNVWGFGFTKKEDVTPDMIDSILQFVGMDNIKLEGDKLVKDDPRMQVDCSAIAKGYSVDIVGDYLAQQGISDYMVEIGGEVVCHGKNEENRFWLIGIDTPIDDPLVTSRTIQEIVSIENMALATSGDYRNFYIKDGKKFAHTINPKTGYPAGSNLLSASVLAKDCTTADAFATAFMVLGLDESKKLVSNEKELEVYFIYSGENGQLETYMTDGFRKFIIETE